MGLVSEKNKKKSCKISYFPDFISRRKFFITSGRPGRGNFAIEKFKELKIWELGYNGVERTPSDGRDTKRICQIKFRMC